MPLDPQIQLDPPDSRLPLDSHCRKYATSFKFSGWGSLDPQMPLDPQILTDPQTLDSHCSKCVTSFKEPLAGLWKSSGKPLEGLPAASQKPM